jgi:hypothetical protein
VLESASARSLPTLQCKAEKQRIMLARPRTEASLAGYARLYRPVPAKHDKTTVATNTLEDTLQT